MSEGTPPQEPREGEPRGHGDPGAPPPGQQWPPPPGDPYPPPGTPPPPSQQGGYPPPPPGYGQPPSGGYGQPPGSAPPPGYGQQPPGGWGAPPEQGWGQGQGGPQQHGGSGLDQNVASGLAYVLTVLTGIIFLLTDKRPEVRFHSMQSILFGITWAVISFLPNVFRIFPLSLIFWLASIGMFVLWIVLMIQAFQGTHFKLPVLGDLAEQQAAKPM
jgi:uncharacterized membrane protein